LGRFEVLKVMKMSVIFWVVMLVVFQVVINILEEHTMV
jgi:hypothetical protein